MTLGEMTELGQPAHGRPRRSWIIMAHPTENRMARQADSTETVAIGLEGGQPPRPAPDATNRLRRRVQRVGPAGDHPSPITRRLVAPLDDDRTRAFGVAGDQEARLPQFILSG
jgi:hypothetical protein